MNSARKADLVLHGGKVWTGYGNPIAEAVAVVGNKILASGSNADIEALTGPDTKVVNLAGRFAMPGLNDAHLHLISTGLLRGKVDATADAAPTRAVLIAALQARAAETPKGAWVMARGFDQTRYPDGLMPTAQELDAALPPTWSHANPVDIIGDAPPERYLAAVETVAGDAGVDAVMVMNCPTGLASPSMRRRRWAAGLRTCTWATAPDRPATSIWCRAAEPSPVRNC